MFTREDFIKYQGMKKIIAEGDYKIKGEAVILAASLFSWLNELEEKISKDIEANKPIKPVGTPKPIGKE